MKLCFKTAIILLLAIVSIGQSAGLTAFPILMTLTEPRSLALGGALISETGWTQGTILNPASAADGGYVVSASYASHMVDMWSGQFTGSFPIMDEYTIGGYLKTFNYGDFDRTVLDNESVSGSFNASENILTLFAAGRLGERLSWGGAVKFIWGAIDKDKASGMAADLGLTYNPDWQRVRLGLVLRNMGTQFSSYGSDTYPLPTELAFGASRKLQHLPMTVNAVLILSREGEGDIKAEFLPGNPGLSFGVSGEMELAADFLDEPLYLRFGYRSSGSGLKVGYQNDMIAGTSYGIGIPIKSYRFDYTFVMMGALGNVHRFGISGTFI